MKVHHAYVRRGLGIALVMLVTGCGTSEPAAEAEEAAAASAESSAPSGIHRGLDAVDESRELATLINARQGFGETE